MPQKHFLVHGAQCRCDHGAKPDKLAVLSQKKEYINDADGSEKLIANTLDIGLPFEAKTFGACSILDGPCAPAVTEWKDFYKNVKLSNGGHILTEESKAVCAVSGKPCISVLFHGQTAQVTAAHFDAVEVDVLALLNPAAPPPTTKKKELPKVKSIKLNFEQRKENKTFASSANGKGKVQVLTARKDEPIKFEVESYSNPKTADTAKVGWKVIKAHAFEGEKQTFAEAGPALSLNFDAVGKYRVVGFGSSDESKQNDTACSLDIEVKENTLKDEFKLDTASARKKNGQYFIRRGSPVTVEALYEFEPAEEERKRVHMILTDEGGNVLQTTEKGTDKLTFKPANTAAGYIVTAVMAPAEPEGEDMHVSKPFKTEANGVVAVTCAQGEKARPGTTMTFTATELTYNTLVEEFETAAIKWQLNGRDVGSGRSITLDGKQYFAAPGNYVVEAYVVKANAWNPKANKPASADEKDDWRFTVQYNTIKAIEGPTMWVAGKKYNFRAVTDMPYDRQKDGDIDWKTPNGTGLDQGEYLRGVYLDTNTKSKVIAVLASTGKTFELPVEAKYAVIERWCFTDEKGVHKSYAGWGEVLTAVIRCKDAAGEKVNIHLLEYDDAGDSNYIKDLGEVAFDAEGTAKATFRTDDIKKALNTLYFEGTYYDVYFGILKKDEGIRFADTKTKEADGKKFLFPAKESNQRDRETAKYVYINGYKQIVDVKFFDAGGYPAYRVYKYGEKITIHIQTRNLAGEKFIYQLWENRLAETDVRLSEWSFEVEKGELTILTLDTGKIKPKNKADEAKVRLFYVILKHSESGSIVFPKQENDLIAFNPSQVNYYTHLKVSGDTQLNEALKVIAPTVLGEPLEGEKSNCGGKYCIKKGDRSELIREINIRLSGFGGNAPTDEFTDQTERMVRQFQRDYMQIQETGKICGDTLRAIDDFGRRYSLHFDDIKCNCGKCKGFGNENYLEEYNNSSIQEAYRKYEYPGIHRSLVWALRAVMFYTSQKEASLGYTVKCISSGYRCHENNRIHNRKTTNHMGKALDIHFNKNGKRTQVVKDLEEIREKIYIKYLNAQYSWPNANKFSLETTQQGATTWVHYDVRRFNLEYLDKRFFVKTQKDLDGESIVLLAKKENSQTCSCGGGFKSNNFQSIIRTNTNFNVQDGKEALKVIYEKYGKDMAIIIERMYRSETAHFKSGQYAKCGTGGMEAFGDAPYYGWDGSFFEANPEYKPVGLWEAFEGKGLSGKGGNKQVTDRKKKFIVLPSVLAGMEYKVFYINRFGGNYARWHSTNPETQEVYRNYLEQITPVFVNEFEVNK